MNDMPKSTMTGQTTRHNHHTNDTNDTNNNDEKEEPTFDFYSPFLLPKIKSGPGKQIIMEDETLILLNSPTFTGGAVLETLWERSRMKICADGGANRLYEYDPLKIPNMICGDLDSLTPMVQHYYEQTSKGHCQIISAPDQNSNDLEKSVQRVIHATSIHVYGALGGRLDQEMASFHALYSFYSKGKHLALYDEDNVAILLPPNTKCQLHFPIDTICGLIPLAHPCESVTTTGLHWNLNGNKLQLGGDLISTSNRFDSNIVQVQTSHPLLFTAQLTNTNPNNPYNHTKT